MKQIIKDVLNDMSESQINLGSDAARETVSSLISAALKTKGTYTEYGDDEIEEQKARDSWVCSICGENTADVDYDYIGSGTNHLGCEMKSWDEIKDHVNEKDDSDSYTGPESKKEPELKFDPITEDLYTDEPYEGLPFREKNWLQKKHENKVFGGDTGIDADFGYDDIPEGLRRAKELAQEALKEGLQKQAYMEMTSDGLPEGGDAQAVLESHKLADEIVDNQEGKWIYESPDGGETVFRRPFSDYDPENKEEIDWETKEPTGKTFIDYPWHKK